MPVVVVVSVIVYSPVCTAVALMRYFRIIPLWSSTGGGVHCRATVLESTEKLVVTTGAVFGAVEEKRKSNKTYTCIGSVSYRLH